MADGRADVAQRLIELVLGELLGAVEQHVLQVVRRALGALGVEHSPRIDREMHDHGIARRVVRAQVVGEAVRELADHHVRVDRQQRRVEVGRLVVVERAQIGRVADRLGGGFGFVGRLGLVCGLFGLVDFGGSIDGLRLVLVDFCHLVVGGIGFADRVIFVRCARSRQEGGHKEHGQEPAPQSWFHRGLRLSAAGMRNRTVPAFNPAAASNSGKVREAFHHPARRSSSSSGEPAVSVVDAY